ncbi:MAG: hypothetical protein ABIT47_00955 [Candidatus Paceibacterota bacterium]
MSLEQPNSYNKLPAGHEAVIQYRPKFIARGGDHLVYETEGHPDTVIKASTFKLKDILMDNAERGQPLDDISDEMRSALEQELEEKNAQIRLYREYFGAKHTLSERRYLMQVPISPEIIEEIYKKDWTYRVPPQGIENIQSAWTAAVIQKKAPQISDPNHLQFSFGGFVEERTVKPDSNEYAKLNDAFLGKETITPEDLELFFKIQDNPEIHALSDLLAKAEAEPALKEAIKDFIGKSIIFANETGNILALAGEDNVILYPQDDTWSFLLVDAIPLYNQPLYQEAKEILIRERKGEVLNKEETGFLTRGYNFVRTMNGLAAALGMTERLQLP